MVAGWIRAVAAQVHRVQADHDRAQLIADLAGQPLHGGQFGGGPLRVGGDECGGGAGGQPQAEQLLGDRIVQLVSDPVAFSHNG
jgi:hypothetical protein